MSRLIVPHFDQLPDKIRDDFQRTKCDDWYINAKSPSQQLSLLNTYSLMKAKDLWGFVKECAPTSVARYTEGNMVFRSTNTTDLKNHLYERKDFTNPTRSFFDWIRQTNTLWDSRSDNTYCQLHLKQFNDWSGNDLFQTHIDIQGVSRINPWQTMVRHGFQNPWHDPFQVNQALTNLPDVRLILPSTFDALR